jgi:RNA polymerase sigma-70 factor (ECF subfamily)
MSEAIGGIGVERDSDSTLVAAAKSGDTQSFEELVLRYRRRVFATALRITNNREDAEDVVQESFHKVFLHLRNFEERSQFSTWLIRIAMNEALMLLRRRRGIFENLPETTNDELSSSFDVFVDQKLNPEESCWQRERTQILTEAINRLGPKVRSTILLRSIEGRSVQEIAQALGTSIGAVKARIFQGRQKLRRTLNPRVLGGFYGAERAEAQRG